MMVRILLLSSALVAAAAPLPAKVARAEPHAIEVTHSVTVPLPPAAAYRLLGRPAAWWSDAHTYSGKAANLSLSLTPGGCFCEALPGGGVEHLRVAAALPAKQLVLTGSLGPLLSEATSGVMDIRLTAAGPGRTQVVMRYKASGFVSGNGSTLALPVDQVLTEQLDRFATAAAKR